ncbi:MAG: 16S rRNA (uracil(1498)-N(3))-methyltransferase [Clostridia bacterium]|nr:16S rRNA (uracil(1498)-N(3))-methyltransferase [Clostridia bacterium]
MHWFYLTEIAGEHFTTDAEESRHISRVLRLLPDERVIFTDGNGQRFTCKLVDNNPRACHFEVIEKQFIKAPPHRRNHLAVAPTKNIARFEWFLEKATEIGIGNITPLQCRHSERIRINPERLHKILVAAIKQSQQTWLPVLNELTPFDEFVNSQKDAAQKLIAYVSDQPHRLLYDAAEPGKEIVVLIGPEGDFSNNEITLALHQRFEPISLGENRLRTETAALVACHTLALKNQ